MLITSLTVIMLAFYILVAAFTLFLTFDERSRSGSLHPIYIALSVFACLVWPVTLIVVAIVAFAMKRRPANGPAAKAQTAG